MKKTDAQILKERAKQYGPAPLMWRAIGNIHFVMENYLLEICSLQGEGPTPEQIGHLAALKQTVVKMVRSIHCPEHEDNYIDGRNYLTIAHECVKNEVRP